MRKLGIYVQVPFCQTKCTYCNFHTGVVASSRFAPYVEAVCREIRGHRELLRGAGVPARSGPVLRPYGERARRQGRWADGPPQKAGPTQRALWLWIRFTLAGGRLVCWIPYICETFWRQFGLRLASGPPRKAGPTRGNLKR